MAKTTEHAAEVLKQIKSEVNEDVIKDYHMPTLCNMETCQDTGFAVVITLNTKYGYTDAVLNDWKTRLEANEYVINVKRSQLQVKFNVRYDS
jgi:phage I-like protein